MKYKGKKYNSILLKISRESHLADVLEQISSIELPLYSGKAWEDICHALIELINNSIRAHKEKSLDENILLRLKEREDGISASISDKGGGFDTSVLPYDLNLDLDKININDDNFMAYREKYEYQRFGMGILVAKRSFQEFHLQFIAPDGQKTEQFIAGETIGTHIELRSFI